MTDTNSSAMPGNVDSLPHFYPHAGDPKMEPLPFPFQRLPLELKIKIIHEAIPRLIIPENLYAPDKPISSAERVLIGDLTSSCKEIRSIVNNSRKIVAFGYGNILFRLDPVRDTLLVKNMCLPYIESKKDWNRDIWEVPRRGLPIRRLMTQSRAISRPKPNGLYFFLSVYRLWSQVPFSTSLDVLSHLPLVEELVLSFKDASRAWHIDGFQMFGPDIIAPRRREEGWGLERVGPHDKAAAEYSFSRGISADTGEKWRFQMDTGVLLSQPSDFISAPIDIQPGQKVNLTPRIGFYGFSRGTRSLGGKWAGFRYFTETGEVHFSPLAWSEVRYFVNRWYHPEAMLESQPQLIARVWIIRPGKEAEPDQQHHCWLKVKKWEEGDPNWVSQVETMWKMMSGGDGG
ncbi:hypothetical protein FAVG1_00354 [Fusarium avenaceum]|nr:hypothetical protein FAVG1_00354 [Fusarium avenaceum]